MPNDRDRLGSEHGGAALMFGLLSILLASVIGVILFAVTISPSGSNGSGSSGSLAGLPFVGAVPSVPGGSSLGSGIGGVPSAAPVASCEADGKTIEVAVLAYQAENGAFPRPPSPWSSATYTANFAPLTSATAKGGPYLNVSTVPKTTHYVVEYDAAGHVWVEPPGQYDASYNPAHNMDAPNTCADVSR
jgi:hypothetical protein